MELGKNIQVNGKWQRVTLTDEEAWEAVKESIELNQNIWSKIGIHNNRSDIFNKVGIPTFTLLKEKLDQKAVNIQEEG